MPINSINIPKLIAHRGASGYAPENTLAAIKRAAALEASWVEFDVMLTADGEAILIHDIELDRTTNGKGPVNELSLADIAKLDAGSWFGPEFQGVRVPTFKNALQTCTELDLGINVEIKPSPGMEVATARKTIELLNTHWMAGQQSPLVSSSTQQCLQVAREMRPDLNLGLIIDRWRPDWQEILTNCQCVSLHVDHHILEREQVEFVHKLGYYVFVFSVNETALAEKLYSWGVDGLFSDFPDLLQ